MRIAAFLALAVYCAAQTRAVTFTTIYSFTGNYTDAAFPSGPLAVRADGRLYGTAGGGDFGTVYELRPPASHGGTWAERVLHNFDAFVDGNGPAGGVVIGEHGDLFGTTATAGFAYQCGNVFQLAPEPGSEFWRAKILFQSFYVYNGCQTDSGVVFGHGGAIYGTTSFGGPQLQACSGTCGTVFKLAPSDTGNLWTQTELIKFTGPDGMGPEGRLWVGRHGEIYGTTRNGGSANAGTVYMLLPPDGPGGSWTHVLLHEFTPATGDGWTPFSGVAMGPDGSLYGTAIWGGANDLGCVFRLTPSASAGGEWTETILYSFDGQDGANPQAGVIFGSDGALYGTTWGGGASPCPAADGTGCGTVFRLTPSSTGATWTETVLHNFTSTDGANPNGPVVFGPNGALYGTTLYGGVSTNCMSQFQTPGCGTAFELIVGDL